MLKTIFLSNLHGTSYRKTVVLSCDVEDDERLKAVVDNYLKWLFGTNTYYDVDKIEDGLNDKSTMIITNKLGRI